MRPEILVTAFGDEAITAAGTDRWDILGKTAPNAEIWSEVVNAAASGRAVAIKCATAP